MSLHVSAAWSHHYKLEAFSRVQIVRPSRFRALVALLDVPALRSVGRSLSAAKQKGFLHLPVANRLIEWFPEFRDVLSGGELRGGAEFCNLITTVGRNELLQRAYKSSAFSASDYVLLTDGTPTFNAADTMASHAGWAEVVAYDESARPGFTPGAVSAGSVDNSASKAEYSINANGTTIGGAALVSDATKSGTTGILIGGGANSGGDLSMDDGETVRVTITATIAAV